MVTDAVEITTCLLSIASLLVLLILSVRRQLPEPIRGYAAALLCALLINAAICGALSGPKGRYEMRLIWILPVVAAAIACASRLVSSRRELEAPAHAVSKEMAS
jgi:hypothetical protein